MGAVIRPGACMDNLKATNVSYCEVVFLGTEGIQFNSICPSILVGIPTPRLPLFMFFATFQSSSLPYVRQSSQVPYILAGFAFHN
nr:hypothetical protein Iba_chr14aCG17860 [Ipomoea batatas]